MSRARRNVHHLRQPMTTADTMIPADSATAADTRPPEPAEHDPALDLPSFPGGLSRREIGAARDFWHAQVTPRGGLAFDALDGFLTVLALLPHPPSPQRWSAVALGPAFAPLTAEGRDQATGWLYRLGTHVAQRVRLDPAQHKAAVLPEFDILPQDDADNDEAAEQRTAKSWSAGAAAALALDPTGLQDIVDHESLRDELAPFVLLGKDGPEDGVPYTRTQRLRLMRAATFGAHRLWKHYQPIRERGGLRVPARAAPLPGRNDPCPCGSGRKFKLCHGAAVH